MTESIFHVPKLRTRKGRATLLAAATSRFSPEAISIERLYRSSRLGFMDLPARLSLVGLLLVFAGCSTVESRIQRNPAAFASLSPADQALVRQGSVRAGMPKAAVYIAWGSPDQTRRGFRSGRPYEAWVYTQIRSVYAPTYYPRFVRFGFHHYYGYWGGYPFGPFGGPFYSDFISVEVPYKAAFFEGNRLTGWEYIQ